MSFANPIWLWGLLALLVPLVIHLLSKKQTQVLPFGSLRFLRESSSSQSRSIELSDIWMLLLRLLLLAMIIIWLTGWISPEKREKKNWLILGEGIELPEAYQDAVDQQLIEVKRARALKADTNYANQWYFMQELAVQHPEIDSLTWIDNFSDADFWGKIPALPYAYELINYTDKNHQSKNGINDTISYKVENLSKENKALINNALTAVSKYSGNRIIYSDKQTKSPDVLFTDNISQEITLQFVFQSSKVQTYIVDNEWPQRIINISDSYLNNALLHDELLVILTEFLGRETMPLWNYNSFEQATVKDQEMQNNPLVYSSINETNEWLFWLILGLLLVERVWAFRKSNA